MNKQKDKSLQERVARLEAAVAELQATLQKINEALPKSKEPVLTTTASAQPIASAPPKTLNLGTPLQKKSAKGFELPENMRSNEYWLNKIGIGLLLFGVAFLFKYSIDQGWLTPPVRVAFGLALGVVLIVLGSRIYSHRRHFSQVLIGGGIATFYITGFAAFQILALVSHPVAFAFMVFVTVLAFVLSLRQDGVALSLIGAIGGLGTPFLLYTGEGNLPGLVGYTCLVLIGTSAIYFYRGWRSLLLTSVAGGWLVFFIGLINGLPSDRHEAITDRWALQSGITFAWLAFWALPLMRAIISKRNPERGMPRPIDEENKISSDAHVHLLSVSTSLITLAMSRPIWTLSDDSWGWITLAGAVVYAFVSFNLSRSESEKNLSHTHALVSMMLTTIGLSFLLEGNSLRFALATEAAVLHFMGRRISIKVATISAHVLYGALALVVIPSLFFGKAKGAMVVNTSALTDLWLIAVAAISSMQFISVDERKIYRIFLHIAILGWLLRELSPLSHGQGFVTIAWGIYAVTLLIVGLRINNNQLRNVAMGTLLVVVGKLFLVDLAELETIWRVLLFLGFGGLFLFLSYYFQALWKSTPKP
jgi:uncharacterized membrane protein